MCQRKAHQERHLRENTRSTMGGQAQNFQTFNQHNKYKGKAFLKMGINCFVSEKNGEMLIQTHNLKNIKLVLGHCGSSNKAPHIRLM